jgi:putative transposase
MPAPISRDLRLRIMRAVERGSSIRAAARRFGVSSLAAIKLMQRVRATGSAALASAGCGALGGATWIRPGSSSSMRAPPPLTWRSAMAAALRRGVWSRRAPWPLAHHDLRRRAQADRHHGTAGAGRAHDRARLPRLR